MKHLIWTHPITIIDEETAAKFNSQVSEILALRNEAYRLTLEAESRFSDALGVTNIRNWGETGFSVRASDILSSGRRRMEAALHSPGVTAIRQYLTEHGQGFTNIVWAGYEVWLPTRFRRVPAEDGVLFVDSADLTETNPDLTKRIADLSFGNSYRGRVEAGWILMARSGQTYSGLNPSVGTKCMGTLTCLDFLSQS